MKWKKLAANTRETDGDLQGKNKALTFRPLKGKVLAPASSLANPETVMSEPEGRAKNKLLPNKNAAFQNRERGFCNRSGTHSKIWRPRSAGTTERQVGYVLSHLNVICLSQSCRNSISTDFLAEHLLRAQPLFAGKGPFSF